MGVLEKLNKAFLKPNGVALGFEPQYIDFETDVKAFDAIFKSLKLPFNYKFDCKKFLEFIVKNPEHKIVYIDNPSNPTGQIIPLKEIKKIAEAANMLIVDEAYGEFMPKKNSAVHLLKDFDNVAVTRSFSKGFGLAGARIGYGVMNPKLGKLYDKVKLVYDANSIGLELACKALKSNVIADSMPKIKSEKKFLIKHFKKFGLEIAKTDFSVPIFLMRSGKIKDLKKFFSEKGIKTADYATKSNSEVRIRVPGSMQKCKEIIKRISE